MTSVLNSVVATKDETVDSTTSRFLLAAFLVVASAAIVVSSLAPGLTSDVRVTVSLTPDTTSLTSDTYVPDSVDQRGSTVAVLFSAS